VKAARSTGKPAKQAEFLRWLGPLLDALRDLGGSATPREALDRIAEKEQVPDQLRNAVLKSGQERFYNQVHWARQYLVWAGLIDSSKRGVWSLTPKGQATHLTQEQSRELFLQQVRRHSVGRKVKTGGDAQATDQHSNIAAVAPQGEEDIGLQNFLGVLLALSPGGFERLCMRLLREAGFDRVQITGRSGDGGVDGTGVLQISDLLSVSVVFQCKKWEQAVPPKEIRDLRGAMDGRAEKGIFLTTSTFSSQARAEAERPGAAPIELVDGEKLFELFKRYELGLHPRTTYDLDFSFFEHFR
jgi:restriction system protein